MCEIIMFRSEQLKIKSKDDEVRKKHEIEDLNVTHYPEGKIKGKNTDKVSYTLQIFLKVNANHATTLLWRKHAVPALKNLQMTA